MPRISEDSEADGYLRVLPGRDNIIIEVTERRPYYDFHKSMVTFKIKGSKAPRTAAALVALAEAMDADSKAFAGG